MKLKVITVAVLAGALLGGCAAAPVAEPAAEVKMEKRVLTGSRIAQEVPADGSSDMHTRTGTKVFSSDDLSATGRADTGGAIRNLSPMIW